MDQGSASSSQQTNRSVEEQRTEKVHVAMEETLISTRKVERRLGPSAQLSKRPKRSEASRTYFEDPRPKPGKPEAP